MAKTSAADPQRLRAWWSYRQGLDGELIGRSAAECLQTAGWARSVGGSGPYLTLFARTGLGREDVDTAVAKLEICELPSARGCTYVLPASDFALGLAVGQQFGGSDMNTARKLGVTEKEIEKLCDAVVTALKKGPLAPDELKECTGGAVRNLGVEGQKKGVTTTLPLALGKLQSSGDIRRVSTNGRLDQQKYKYALWKPNPLKSLKLSREECFIELARRFFRWIGPATLGEFQWFSGLGVKATKAATESLNLGAIPADSDRFVLPEDLDKFQRFTVPRTPQYAFVSSLDSMFLLRRDLKGLLEQEDLTHRVLGEKGLRAIGDLADLPSNAVLDRGRIVGLWEYDPEAQSVAWTSFIGQNDEFRRELARTEEYVRKDLGDARSFSLDSPKSRQPRIAALRKAHAAS